jgi:uncharacterized membrane protein YphA (DoxX/SURF4 family)
MEFLLTVLPILASGLSVIFFCIARLFSHFAGTPNTWQEDLVLTFRYVLGVILALAGLEKLTGIGDIIGPHDLIDQLEPHGLGLYGVFISVSELVIGLLLLNRRLATLGAIMAFPLFVNIFVVVVSLGWRGTPVEVAGFLALNLVLLAADWHKLKFLVDEPTAETRAVKIEQRIGAREYAFVALAAGLTVLALLAFYLGWSAGGLVWGGFVALLLVAGWFRREAH